MQINRNIYKPIEQDRAAKGTTPPTYGTKCTSTFQVNHRLKKLKRKYLKGKTGMPGYEGRETDTVILRIPIELLAQVSI